MQGIIVGPGLLGPTNTGTWTDRRSLLHSPAARRGTGAGRPRDRGPQGRPTDMGPRGPGQQQRRPPGAALVAASGLAPTCPHAESAQVWRTATGKFAGSHRAEAPEANYRRRPGQAIDLSHIHVTVFHTDTAGSSSQETPVQRVSMVTTWTAPHTKYNNPSPPGAPGS